MRRLLSIAKSVADAALRPLGYRIARLPAPILAPDSSPQPLPDNDAIVSNLRWFLDHRPPGELPPRETVLKPEIVIPCYNHGRFLEGALASVVGSGIPVTVVNDASTDSTPDEIRRLGASYGFKAIENQTNIGQALSVNRAIEESDATLIITLDADDVMLPWGTDTILRLWSALPDVRLIGAGCIISQYGNGFENVPDLPARLTRLPEPRIFLPEEVRTLRHILDLNMTNSGMSFVRSAWQAAGKHRPARERVVLHQDRDLQLRIGALFPIAVIDTPLVIFRYGTSVKRDYMAFVRPSS